MSNVGKAIIVLGLIGIEGAIYTGSGWFVSSVLIIIGCTLWIYGKIKERKKVKRCGYHSFGAESLQRYWQR